MKQNDITELLNIFFIISYRNDKNVKTSPNFCWGRVGIVFLLVFRRRGIAKLASEAGARNGTADLGRLYDELGHVQG